MNVNSLQGWHDDIKIMLATGHHKYYLESIKLYYLNCILYNQVEKITEERNALAQRLQKCVERECLSKDLTSLDCRSKRNRRRASEIDRSYQCPLQNCQKSYGNEGSLIQHLKLKHQSYALHHLKPGCAQQIVSSLCNK